ncbi:DUF2971 domain-containing protein [Listeria grayi]|uniref:DUF2971 domain-containing protein n=1 Tax=Listeria grayi DSM 20601 TaxID=525367 RepID=D7UZI8_LISGR|nr:hypothetical protein [Listeria grayi]EFI82833.1 hypothetical protein HMPREF0556_11518 [Listeria grayi DSM 20601]
MKKRLKDVIDYSKLDGEMRSMIEKLPESAEQALIEIYDEDSDFIRYARLDNIYGDFSISDTTELYHYTSYENLVSIIEGKKFWIKNKSFMNDPKEFNYTYELCEILLSQIDASGDEINEFKSIVNTTKFDIYLWCFSENKASQALWGNYGNKNGVALRMNMKVLMESLAVHFSNGKDNLNDYTVGSAYVIPLKILYNQEEQMKRLKIVLLQWLRARRNNQFDPVDMSEIKDYCLQALFTYALMMKNPLLYQEEEARFIILNFTEGNEVNPEFYDSSNVPYVSCPLTDSMLSEVVIQTGSSIKHSDVKSILSIHGYLKTKISDSILPY